MAGNYENKVSKIVAPTEAELYKISSVAGAERYTNYINPITFSGEVYIPAAITRSSPGFSSEFKSVSLSITAPVTLSFLRYVGNSPILPSRIEIYRVHVDELTSYLKIFSGIIKSITIKDKVATAECESFFELFSRRIPSVVHQSFCNHTLFDLDGNPDGCTLNPSVYEVFETVSISGNTLTNAIFATYDDGYFAAGRADWDGDMREITSHVGDTLTLHIPFPSEIGASNNVKVYPGCDKSPETCQAKFSNLDNFLGFFNIPGDKKNPVIIGVR